MSESEIFLSQLRLLGYKKDIGDINKLKNTDFVDIILFLFSFFPKIEDLPKANSNIKINYKYCETIINSIKKIVKDANFTYDSIMYPNPERISSILSSLLEAIPKKENNDSKNKSVGLCISPLTNTVMSLKNEFLEARNKKENMSYNYQALKQINTTSDTKKSQKLSDIYRSSGIKFHSKELVYSSGRPLNYIYDRNTYSTLLNTNDRDYNVDLTFSRDLSRSFKKIDDITRRALLNNRSNEISTLNNKSVFLSTKARSRIVNSARFDHQTEKVKIGQSAVAPTVETTIAVDENNNTHETVENRLTYREWKELSDKSQQGLREVISEINSVENQISELENGIQKKREEISKLSTSLSVHKSKTTNLQDELNRVQHLQELAQADSSQIKNLQRDLVLLTSEIMDMAREWEPIRVELIHRLRQLNSQIRDKSDQYGFQLARLTKLKKMIQESDEKLRNNQSMIDEISGALSSRGSGRPRSEYIEEIFRINSVINKQEAEIENTRNDIKKQSSTLNSTSEKVSRTWALLDELIYREAKEKNEDWIKETYKLVADILGNYERILLCLEETGKIKSNILDMNQRIENAENQVDVKRLEQIENDLREVKKEIESRK